MSTYYLVKHRKDSYSLDGLYDSPTEALLALNYSYQRALEQGFDNRNVPWAIYRMENHKEFDKDGDYIGSYRSERLWYKVEFSEINEKFVMDI